MTTALTTLTDKLAAKLDMGDDGRDLIDTLKLTAFKGQVSDAQMTALLVVANQYGLNPWVKEIYAFPDQNNGIVPVVGVDGWSRIINQHPQFDGMDFEQDAESCTCIIYRKDRGRPVRVTEFKDECARNTKPWQSHPRRMLRHKAMIQCARLAFGYTGIYDQDEAERIVERDMGAAEVVESPKTIADIAKQRAAQRKAQGPALVDVLAAIESAHDKKTMAAAKSLGEQMDDGPDKERAIEAYKARVAELKARSERSDDSGATLADALSAVNAGDLDLARDIARSLDGEDRQRAESAIADTEAAAQA